MPHPDLAVVTGAFSYTGRYVTRRPRPLLITSWAGPWVPCPPSGLLLSVAAC